MDTYPQLRKFLTVGIILFLVGTLVIPSTRSQSPRMYFTASSYEIPIIDIDSISRKVPDNNSLWGFIISTEFIVTYVEATNTSKSVDWWGGPLVEFTVIGIGKHFVQYTCNYSIYTNNSPQPFNGSFNGSDDLYLCNLHKKPIIKIKATDSGIVLNYLFKKGTWIGKLYIDGTLIETLHYSYEHI